jgi:hypothetical protein
MLDFAVVEDANSLEGTVVRVKELQPCVLLLDSASIAGSGIPTAAKVKAFGGVRPNSRRGDARGSL